MVEPKRAHSVVRLWGRLSSTTGTLVLILITLLLTGCGHGFADNMAQQMRYDPYERNSFFADDGASRQLVPGTVPRIVFHVGHAPRLTQAQFDHLDPSPPKRITLGLLLRGEQRFNIYCAPCHGRDGYATGMVVLRGYPSPPVLFAPRLRKASDAHLFDVITHGLGKMPPYGGLVPVPDRWAIIAYVRALQLSQHAPASDAPANVQEKLFGQSFKAGPGQESATAKVRIHAGAVVRASPRAMATPIPPSWPSSLRSSDHGTEKSSGTRHEDDPAGLQTVIRSVHE